ncbi:MAG: aspartate/glutamate racemase family protein [Demequinaceae bacterium]|nr:aspartate/glutamate racemase family protein [Demequinaceae bacterium]
MDNPPRKLGLLGGMTWESSLVYERLLNEGTRERLGGSHSADLIVRSYDFQTLADAMTAGDWAGLGDRFTADAVLLETAGAEAILLCANTMHKVADRVAEAVSVPFLHIIDATADAILASGLTTVALLGTGYTMRDAFYRDHMTTRGITALVPDEPDIVKISEVIFGELAKGVFLDESRDAFRRIVNDLKAKGAEGVIAGCTEIPLLLRAEDVDMPYFDSLDLHVKAALDFSLDPGTR